MSNRTVLSRPRRTKVYDYNYSLGERYYRPVVEGLDKKYGGRSSSPAVSAIRDAFADGGDAFSPPPPRRLISRDDDDFSFEEPRRRPASALLEEYDSIFESRPRVARQTSTPNRARNNFEDEADQAFSASLKRIQASRAAFDEEAQSTRRNLKYSEKVLDTVGIKNSDIDNARTALEDDVFFKKRTLRMTKEDDTESPSMTRWSKFGAGINGAIEETGELGGSAVARARASKARLADLDNEMEELAARSEAREKRKQRLRDLIEGNEAASANEATATIRVKKTTVTAEKKSVAF